MTKPSTQEPRPRGRPAVPRTPLPQRMTAAQLVDLRARAGITQARAAALAGVTLRTLQKWEAEDQAIPLSSSALLAWSCHALGGPLGLLAPWMPPEVVERIEAGYPTAPDEIAPPASI